ncbi:tetratricopeptide repeat protein [Alkalisalibacterium limincola]|uniref:Tetratricopeptide repeat protein n=1 Tax=Alkalisalibacterium limincola TaxID=2699169 RepID=A0A5C8KIZ9_9GAMM|nr:tetratricopeptide repeat protein [Alkalisalibacterium limincola]TXK59072.1 tetratricopeptide repeat protein [Alkalisalibacterium limincola]
MSQLTTIKWLLAAIAVCAFGVVAIFFVLAANMISVGRESRLGNLSQYKSAELEDMLAAGESKTAKLTAMDWLSSQPRRPEAHWALAKAHYQLGELSEAKQVLRGLLKVAPEEHYRVDAWLELLENEFSENRPKPVAPDHR